MPTIERKSGLRVNLPSHLQVFELPTAVLVPAFQRSRRVRARGPIPLPSSGISEETDQVLLKAFEAQELKRFDELEVAPVGQAPFTRRQRPSAAADIELDVPLAADEGAVLLLEQGGMYSWSMPAEEAPVPAPRTRRGSAQPTEARRATFHIELLAEAPERSPARRGVIANLVLGRVKAYVLKFVARIVISGAMEYLERNVRRGLVDMCAEDPAAWRLVAELAALKTPTDRPARLLLFVHGTFSSTAGAFGALGQTPWGQTFLAAARSGYDLILGFDHPTLSIDPKTNAEHLLTVLRSIRYKVPPKIDVVTHSRGGLVVRSLLEHLLPGADWRPQIGKVVFVAAPNRGTLLAEPENWKTLADLYVNLAVGTFTVLKALPQATAAAVVLQELIQGLGAFIRYAATYAVTDGAVPGLAAMEPDGPFVTLLNQTQERQPRVEISEYCAIVSEFRPRLTGDHQPRELPQRFLQWLAGRFMAQLMRDANDLVVNTASMTAIDLHLGPFVKDILDFGENPQVYHTNYFTRPEVVNALARWLKVPAPAPVPKVRSTRGSVQRAPTVAGASPTLAGGVARPDVPAAVDTDILVTTAEEPLNELREAVREKMPSYVVVRRDDRGTVLDYALRAEEVLTAPERGDLSVLEAFSLQESDASLTRLLRERLKPELMSQGAATASRSVVLAGGRPFGVVPERSELPDIDGLVELAWAVLQPKDDLDRVRTRRTLPTLTESAAAPVLTRGRRAVSTKVTLHFHAEMEEEVVVKRAAVIEVLVSREAIERAAGRTSTSGNVKVDSKCKLLVQVVPIRNLEVIGKEQEEIDLPAPGAPMPLVFNVRPTHLGEGEIWVVVRQIDPHGLVPLITLELAPRIVQVKGETAHREVVSASTGEASPLRESLTQLFITEYQNGDEISYRYQLQSPEFGLLKWALSNPFKGNRETYVTHLYEEIEERWVSTGEDAVDFAEELRAFGASLFDELFPEELQRVLWHHRDRIDSVMVISTEPFIPWELVHLKETGKPLSPQGKFLGQMGLVRWLHEAGWPVEGLRLRKGKGRARYVIPQYVNPEDKLPEAEKEAEFLERTFGAERVDPFPGPVRKLLSQGNFDLLHFACHGVAEQDNITNAQLLLQERIEGKHYIPQYFSATTVEQHSDLVDAAGNRPLVVLNACQVGREGYKLTGVGGFAQAFLRRGASVFVSTLWSVGDSPARTFTETFYEQLRAGKTISQAAIAGRQAAQDAGDATWLAYVVYGHPHARVIS